MRHSMMAEKDHDVPQALVRAMFSEPEALQAALDRAGLAPHHVAMWARRTGNAQDLEKLAGWLSVGRQPDHHKPLLEVAASHLRAGELLEALPVFRWAYLAWQRAPGDHPAHAYDGAKLLALWGECLHRLGVPHEALERWLWALAVVPDAETLSRLARTVERNGDAGAYHALVQEAIRRRLPGARALRQRQHRQAEAADVEGAGIEMEEIREIEETAADAVPEFTDPDSRIPASRPAVAVMADVSNLDMVCHDQYGPGRRLDYGRLLGCARRHGQVGVQIAFVPDMPETMAVRRELVRAGFEIDLKRPKLSHGRLEANADTAMAAAAVRWASEPTVGRVELWTGDGDFLKVREVVADAWPDVAVTFRSFEAGTAGAIRRLGDDWMSIGPEYLQV